MMGSRGQIIVDLPQIPSQVASPTADCFYSPGRDRRQPRKSFSYATLGEEAKEVRKMLSRQQWEQQKWKDSKGL